MSDKIRVEGIYYNTSPEPVFFEGSLVGGHEHVYIDGYVRIPGHFVLMDDPQADDNAPEPYKRAYEALKRKADEREGDSVHANSNDRKVDVIVEDTPEEAPEDVDAPALKPTRTSRRGKRDSSADAGDSK